MYESMKVRVEDSIERGRVEEAHIDVEMQQIFAKWTTFNFTPQIHPTIIEVQDFSY